jgi:lysophospholipase L1-like esterase
LAGGMHTLTVAQGKDYNYVFDFQGLILDAGATTAAPSILNCLIEYIGDSITSGYTDPQADVSDYAWVCSEDLDAEHTQIAYPGINLVSGYTSRGMDIQYFKQRSLKYLNSPNWDLTKYTPKIIVINLGTNDVNNRVPKDVFQNDYVKFLTEIRAKYPKTEIFAMRTFSGAMAIQTLAAINIRKRDGDKRVHYINTTSWLTKGTGDFTDGTHPSVNGHIKVAKLLRSILLPYLD